MSNKTSAVKPSECENVAKKSRISVTLEKQVGRGKGVIRRMEDGQTRADVCGMSNCLHGL